MILVEHVTGCDRIGHELNDSDSVRGTPGLLVPVEGNLMDSLAPQGSTLFIMPLFLDTCLRDLTAPPAGNCGLAEAPAAGTGYGVCMPSLSFISKWPILTPPGYMLRVSTKQWGRLQNFHWKSFTM